MAKSFFPEEMMKTTEMSLETIVARLTYFHEQLHLIHWQTTSYAEHMSTGELYDYVHDFKDKVIEKLMGYMGKRPKASKAEPISDAVTSQAVVADLITFANELKVWAGNNKYDDVENMAQSLSGKAAKVKYLLTLS